MPLSRSGFAPDTEARPTDAGALSVKTGAAGTLYWDEFVSRRQTYIGP
jgi:hypothetical protein